MKNTLKFNFKKNNGITLIALVITIIVLLILAGVSIAMLTGENSILGRGSQASAQNQLGAAQDAVSLLVADKVAEFYDKAYVEGNTTILKDGLNTYLAEKAGIDLDEVYDKIDNKSIKKADVKVDWTGYATSGTTGADVFEISITDNTKTYTTTGHVTNGKVTWSMGSGTKTADAGNTTPAAAGPTIVGEDTPQIGDAVNYDPGTLTTENIELPEGAKIKRTELASLHLPDGATLESVITASSATNWVILDYNSKTGEVLIIPRNYDTTKLTLSGMDGYNNAEEALDMVAGIYINPDYAKSARSIRVEDVNKLSGYNPNVDAQRTTNNELTLQYSWNSRYEMDTDTAEIIDHGEGHENEVRIFKCNPKISSYQYGLSEETAATDSDEPPFVPSEAAYTILGNTNCWLASRCILLSEGDCYFRVRYLEGCVVSCSSYLWDVNTSEGNSNSLNKSVLPVVSLKSGVSMEKDSNSVWQLTVE